MIVFSHLGLFWSLCSFISNLESPYSNFICLLFLVYPTWVFCQIILNVLLSWKYFLCLLLAYLLLSSLQVTKRGRSWQWWWSQASLCQRTGPLLSMRDWIDILTLSSRTGQLLSLVVEMGGYPLQLLRSGCLRRYMALLIHYFRINDIFWSPCLGFLG